VATEASRRAELVALVTCAPDALASRLFISYINSVHTHLNTAIPSTRLDHFSRPPFKDTLSPRNLNTMDHPQTPRILAPHLNAFQHRIVRILGKVVQLRGDNAVIDAGGNVDLILNRVSSFFGDSDLKPHSFPHYTLSHISNVTLRLIMSLVSKTQYLLRHAGLHTVLAAIIYLFLHYTRFHTPLSFQIPTHPIPTYTPQTTIPRPPILLPHH